jgi:hypothetical protein
MEQEAREVTDGYVVERRLVLEEIETAWATQSRRPTADEVDNWIRAGRRHPYLVETAFW